MAQARYPELLGAARSYLGDIPYGKQLVSPRTADKQLTRMTPEDIANLALYLASEESSWSKPPRGFASASAAGRESPTGAEAGAERGAGSRTGSPGGNGRSGPQGVRRFGGYPWAGSTSRPGQRAPVDRAHRTDARGPEE